MILGTSDSWSTIHLSYRSSDPAYYIVNWRISIVVLYSSWTPGLQWILSNHWETKTAIKFAAISWPPLAPADRPSRNPWERSQYHKRILILFCLKSTFTYFYKNYLLKPWQKRRTKRLLDCFKNTWFFKKISLPFVPWCIHTRLKAQSLAYWST